MSDTFGLFRNRGPDEARALQQMLQEKLEGVDFTILTNEYYDQDRGVQVLQLVSFQDGQRYGGEIAYRPDEVGITDLTEIEVDHIIRAMDEEINGIHPTVEELKKKHDEMSEE